MKYCPFQPRQSTPNQTRSYKISVTGSSGTPQKIEQGSVLRLHNTGAAQCYINFGQANVAATTSDIPLGIGQCEVVSVPDGCEYFNTIGDSTTTLHVTPGDGL